METVDKRRQILELIAGKFRFTNPIRQKVLPCTPGSDQHHSQFLLTNVLIGYVTWTRVQVSDTGMCPTRVLLNFYKFFHIFERSERYTNIRICVGHECRTRTLSKK